MNPSRSAIDMGISGEAFKKWYFSGIRSRFRHDRHFSTDMLNAPAGRTLRFAPALAAAAVVVAVSCLTRVFLALRPDVAVTWGFAGWAGIFGLGLLFDVLAALYLVAPLVTGASRAPACLRHGRGNAGFPQRRPEEFLHGRRRERSRRKRRLRVLRRELPQRAQLRPPLRHLAARRGGGEGSRGARGGRRAPRQPGWRGLRTQGGLRPARTPPERRSHQRREPGR